MGDVVFQGIHREILEDASPEVCVSGALSCGKTTVCLWKELEALRTMAGIWIFISRYSDKATTNLLKPAFEQLARVHSKQTMWAKSKWSWNREEAAYEFDNGSRCFAFGMQTQSHDPDLRYGKLRGLAVSRIYVDQTESVPEDVASELRARLRPDIEARMKGVDYPRQLTFSPNPTPKSHWLSRQFPSDDSIPGRKYFEVSLFHNKANLPTETIDGLLRTYPPSHTKHRMVILGQRGSASIGDPVYGGTALDSFTAFQRSLHEVPVKIDNTLPLLESIESGKRNCAVVWAQITPFGQLHLLGGLVGQRMSLEDFAPVVNRYRIEWFPQHMGQRHTCCNPHGSHEAEAEIRENTVATLRDLGFAPTWKDNSNSPDVRYALIGRVASYMRKRTPRGEGFAVEDNPERWLRISGIDIEQWKFMADGLESGYVWSDIPVSVASKEITQTKKDDEYEFGMSALELLEYNFGGPQVSADKLERHAARTARQALVAAQRDDKDAYRWPRLKRTNRAGY